MKTLGGIRSGAEWLGIGARRAHAASRSIVLSQQRQDVYAVIRLVADVPNQRLVTRIVNTDLGYSGQWTYELTHENGGARVKITEDGEVSNALFRFMSRYLFGHTSTIDTYLTALTKKFGETATPQ